jgi:hypothetical protein
MTKIINCFILTFLVPIYSFAQEVVHPFSVGGTCLPKVDAFIKQGLNANTCAQIKSWTDGLAAMQGGECGRVFIFAKLSNSGNKTALDVIGNQNIEKLKRLRCDDSDGQNLGNSQNSTNTNSGGGQNNTNANGNFLLGRFSEKGIQNEINRQQAVTDTKGPNKYSYIQEIDENSIKADLIFLNNGSQLKVIIVKITDEQITYKKVTIPDGPTFIVKIINVNKIKFINGQEQTFNLK